MVDKFDLVSGMGELERSLEQNALDSFNPEDAKYRKAVAPLKKFLTASAEWNACAFVQYKLIETRAEFGQATEAQVAEVAGALKKFDALNASLLEDHPDIRHDQVAVLKEFGRHLPESTVALLHPGTTSYDILDTARAYLFKQCWKEALRPQIVTALRALADIAQGYVQTVRVGRTHLQDTSPVSIGGSFAISARNMAESVQFLDGAFDDLRGKVSGIVGTGASIDAVIGAHKSLEFEEAVLRKLDLKADETATQITNKARLSRVAYGLTELMAHLRKFSTDMRILYSSPIKEVTDLDAKKRLGGSSADAGKNNPINWENMAGKYAMVKAGFDVAIEQMNTNFERDLCNSVQGRYEPGLAMSRVYESFGRLTKAMGPLFVNKDRVLKNLEWVRKNPSEALTAITRGHAYVHPKFGIGHDTVKAFTQQAQELAGQGKEASLMSVALADPHFAAAFATFSDVEKSILGGNIENYVGHAMIRAHRNIAYVRKL